MREVGRLSNYIVWREDNRFRVSGHAAKARCVLDTPNESSSHTAAATVLNFTQRLSAGILMSTLLMTATVDSSAFSPLAPVKTVDVTDGLNGEIDSWGTKNHSSQFNCSKYQSTLLGHTGTCTECSHMSLAALKFIVLAFKPSYLWTCIKSCAAEC